MCALRHHRRKRQIFETRTFRRYFTLIGYRRRGAFGWPQRPVITIAHARNRTWQNLKKLYDIPQSTITPMITPSLTPT